MIKINFDQVVSSRRSVRKYRPDPVSGNVIRELLQYARLAPSWRNLQCWQFIVVQDQEKKQELSRAMPAINPARKAVAQAPAVIVLAADPSQSGSREGKDYYLVDAGIVMDHLVLAAAARGLGTCWVGLFQEEKVKGALKIPHSQQVVALTPLGYPAVEPSPRPRKGLEEIACSEEWGRPLSLGD